jgi:hypothetical protein
MISPFMTNEEKIKNLMSIVSSQKEIIFELNKRIDDYTSKMVNVCCDKEACCCKCNKKVSN